MYLSALAPCKLSVPRNRAPDLDPKFGESGTSNFVPKVRGQTHSPKFQICHNLPQSFGKPWSSEVGYRKTFTLLNYVNS